MSTSTPSAAGPEPGRGAVPPPPTGAVVGAGAPRQAQGPQQAQPQTQPQSQQLQQPQQHRITRTRTGGLWVALTAGAVVLLLLLIFILENGQRVDVAYFGVHGHLPLGVALLLAAVCGVLLVLIPGAGRILQLRRTARKHRAMDRDAAGPGPSTPGTPDGERRGPDTPSSSRPPTVS